MSAELSSLGIAQIVESAIADYDLHDENGNELTDDLYVIRSERIADLGFEVAKRIRKATHELEQGGKTGHSIHSMTFGSVPVTIAKDGDRTYTLRFDNSDEAVAITRLSRTALADIRKQINDFLNLRRNHHSQEWRDSNVFKGFRRASKRFCPHFAHILPRPSPPARRHRADGPRP